MSEAFTSTTSRNKQDISFYFVCCSLKHFRVKCQLFMTEVQAHSNSVRSGEASEENVRADREGASREQWGIDTYSVNSLF